MLKKIISVVSAAVLCLTALTACGGKKKNDIPDGDIVINEVEPETSASSETGTVIPAETYPDYPISYPEIEEKRTGDLYEAEDAWMTEDLRVDSPVSAETSADGENGEGEVKTKKKFSGDGYVTGFSPTGSSFVLFEADIPTNQHYDLSFSISSTRLIDCRVTVNDEEISTFKTMNDGEFTLITLYGVFLTEGTAKIELRPLAGNIKLDYMKIANNTSLSSISYDAEGEPVNKEAGKSAKELLAFLTDIYGEYTLTGQYASDETNKELELVFQTTGKYPAIRFSAMHNTGSTFDSTFEELDACADWYRNGGIVGLMWYWDAPSEKKPSVYASETDFKLSDAVTDIDIAKKSQEEIRGLFAEGKISEQCYGLILDIDNMAGQLLSLKNKGVPVLWRPLHEGSGDWFWWGASGTEAYKWLWDLMYRRFTEYFMLDNLIWVWNGQSEDTLVDPATFDIASLDIYLDKDKRYGSRYEQFLALQKLVGKDKLIALSECSTLPDIDSSFRDNAVWSFFGLWYGKYLSGEDGSYSEEYTKKDDFVHVYNSDGALTLDEYIKLRDGEKLVPEYDGSVTTAAKTTAASKSTSTATVTTKAE